MSENNEKNEGIFDEPKPRYTAKKKHHDDFRRQARILLIVFLIAMISLFAYLFVIKPIVEKTEEIPEELPVLLDGEVLGPQNRILIMEYLKKDDIASVDVHNEHGDFGFEYNEEDDAFYLKGNKSAAYSKEVFQNLLSAAGYTLAMERITDYTENFSEYGLSELDNPAWYILTGRNGTSHKLYIGDPLPSGAGYYVRYDGRDAVYVLDYTISETLLAPIEAIIAPTLAFPAGQSGYYMLDNFALKKDGEIAIALEYLDEETRKASGIATMHRFIYPEEYVPSDTSYLEVFAHFADYTGISTLVYQPDIDDIKKYGLEKPKYDLYFEVMGMPNNIIFSEKNENGNYYAYSPVFDIISEVEASKADWLEWGLLNWIERPLLQVSIFNIDEISIESEKADYRFVLESDEAGVKSVYEAISQRDITDIDNFKKFYQTILMTNLQDYAELTEDKTASLEEEGPYMTMTVKMKDNTSKVYKFYPYETRRAYYTTNGVGDFYIIRDRMVKIIDDAAKVVAGETVVPEANN
ncbi:MAG: DUF4340 domain-containing protein [Ruminococcaceae bacterium]|nr:DUF4340 domain-containing protein [Oscillospiraceae bacterium]